MSEITRHLSYNDINLLKSNTEGKHKEKEENQELEQVVEEPEEQKEIQ